jgi:hypothetical protein
MVEIKLELAKTEVAPSLPAGEALLLPQSVMRAVI